MRNIQIYCYWLKQRVILHVILKEPPTLKSWDALNRQYFEEYDCIFILDIWEYETCHEARSLKAKICGKKSIYGGTTQKLVYLENSLRN